jgi:hypothetical protein
MSAVCACQTSVSFYETAVRNIPEHRHLHTCRRENLTSRLYFRSASIMCKGTPSPSWDEALAKVHTFCSAIIKSYSKQFKFLHQESNKWICSYHFDQSKRNITLLFTAQRTGLLRLPFGKEYVIGRVRCWFRLLRLLFQITAKRLFLL